jgi:regulator of replication initiation timing
MARTKISDLTGALADAAAEIGQLRGDLEALRKSHATIVARNTALALEVQTLRTKLAAVPA